MIGGALLLVFVGSLPMPVVLACSNSPITQEPSADDWRAIPGMETADERVAAFVDSLARVDDGELSGVLQLAFEEFLSLTRSYRLELARTLAEAMHARAAAGWSAMSLALIATRSGDSARAQQVLELEIARTPEGPRQYELLERLGLALQGAGNEPAALGPLGSAFARGSSNAGVVLGRIALREGRLGQARAIFRTLLIQDPPQSWALRGWGLSMLPRDPRAP